MKTKQEWEQEDAKLLFTDLLWLSKFRDYADNKYYAEKYNLAYVKTITRFKNICQNKKRAWLLTKFLVNKKHLFHFDIYYIFLVNCVKIVFSSK